MKRIILIIAAIATFATGTLVAQTATETVTDTAPTAAADNCTAWSPNTYSYSYRCYLTGGVAYEYRTTVICYSAAGEQRVYAPWTPSGQVSTAVCPSGWNAGRLGSYEARPYGMGGTFKYWYNDDAIGRCYTEPNRSPHGANQNEDPWACGNRNQGSAKGYVLVQFPGDSQRCYKRYFSYILLEHDRGPAYRLREVDWSGPLRYTC